MPSTVPLDIREALQNEANVSRETIERLAEFVDILKRWNRSINLVSRSDLEEVWRRHVLDSLGALRFLASDGPVLDIGSGGGFPALVLAVALRDQQRAFTLVESDVRKCVFLREASRQLELNAVVRTERIEQLPLLGAVTLTSRAFASVEKTLTLIEAQLPSLRRIVLLKGNRVFDELTEASDQWHIEHQVLPNALTGRGYMLIIEKAQRVKKQ
ncbi:MAG: 16S rRNA (guanine(527)-N(7))-methyltransferase RsmG [Pseudomonadota bacterium]